MEFLELWVRAQFNPRHLIESVDTPRNWVPKDLLWCLGAQLGSLLHFGNEAVESGLGLLFIAANRVDSEADVQRLLQFVVERRPLTWWHDLQLPVVSLKLYINLLALFADSSITLFRLSFLSLLLF